ncbi:hypothetical protein A3K86_04940 [Photobacterium jeanii]|uniref:Metallo-beta-lactamase domain-containing protein n=1 Tax=Photobacterium jeanii TaxID=858640 RepID=A0A178KQG9_9GAMM|nr:hypothetical protein A3K86_04940 [Photobacterium jeanii]
MTQAAIGFSIGVLSLHGWFALPTLTTILMVSLLGGGIALFIRFNYRYYAVANVIFGSIAGIIASYSTTYHYVETVKQVPAMGANITIVGEVDSIQNVIIPTDSFDFTAQASLNDTFTLTTPLKLRLFWPQASAFKQGQRLQIKAVIRRPYGRVNQAGFDAETWFVGHRYHGRGTVVSAVVLDADRAVYELSSVSVRQQLFDRAVALMEAAPHRGLLLALSFGVRGDLSDHDWLWLRDSGLAHLMAISGLHIGLAFGLGWWFGKLCRGLLPESPCLLWFPLWLGLLFALSYAWLAGFSLPTLRALFMACLAMLLLRCYVLLPHWTVLLFALALCLAFDPLASYAMGFWFSFAAVAVLLFINASNAPLPDMSIWTLRWRFRIKQLFVLQFTLLLLMLPLQWYFFGGFAFAAPLVNFVVIPWVSVVVVPVILAAIVTLSFPSLSSALWTLADHALFPVQWLGEQTLGHWLHLSSFWLPVGVGCVLLTALLRWLPFSSFKVLYISLALGLVSWQGWRIQTINESQDTSQKSWQIDMLDVGHGLAVLISRNGRAVLYDTGNRFPNGSIATSVIEPVLKAQGIRYLDGLILSHADSDHAGGADFIVQRFSPQWLRSSDVRESYLPCIQGQRWQWQGLTFEVLWPPKRVKRAANPHSCVVRVHDGLLIGDDGKRTEVLFTGDIDAISELLMARLFPMLNPDILFVPHHGSATSSTATWLADMTPQYALVSVARYNPWGLPVKSVEQRYHDKRIPWLSTAEIGQVSLQIAPSKGQKQNRIQFESARRHYQRTWYRSLFVPDAVDVRVDE